MCEQITAPIIAEPADWLKARIGQSSASWFRVSASLVV